MLLHLNCPHSWCRDLADEIESKPRKKQPVRLTMFYRLHIA